MFSLLWKAPLVLVLALLVAAAGLVHHARARLAAMAPVRLPPALSPPPDGLARTKRAAIRAVEIESVRAAVRAFNENEGHPPQSLTELVATGYLRSSRASIDLRHIRYDPHSMNVSDAACQ